VKHHAASARYQKIVYWSDEDRCFVGRCPGLLLGGVHGRVEAAVYRELCEAVDEQLTLIQRDGTPLPEATVRRFSGVFNLRIDPAMHRALTVRAHADGDSLNQYVERILTRSMHGASTRARKRSSTRDVRSSPARRAG